MVDVNPPRGTRDFFPEDKRLQNWLFGEFAEVSRLFGFEQVDFPVLESGELGPLSGTLWEFVSRAERWRGLYPTDELPERWRGREGAGPGRRRRAATRQLQPVEQSTSYCCAP